jgi:glycerol-3-phosphate dehydrogenase
LVTIIGGKWTTFRRMAQDTIDKAIEIGAIPSKACVTEELHIHGYDTNVNHQEELHFYGSDLKVLKQLEAENTGFAEKLSPNYGYTVANVVFAVRNELANKVEDVLGRRFRLLFLDAKTAVNVSRKVAEIMAKELGKSQDWIDQEVSDFAKVASVYQLN